jgi:hypothetical protein
MLKYSEFGPGGCIFYLVGTQRSCLYFPTFAIHR